MERNSWRMVLSHIFVYWQKFPIVCMIYSKGVAWTLKNFLEIFETNYINNCLWLHQYVLKFNAQIHLMFKVSFINRWWEESQINCNFAIFYTENANCKGIFFKSCRDNHKHVMIFLKKVKSPRCIIALILVTY